MAMTLRLTPVEDEALSRLAKAFNTSKNLAAAAAIDLAAARPSHEDFVLKSTERLMTRYAALVARLADA